MKLQYLPIISCLSLVLSVPFPGQVDLVKRQSGPISKITPEYVDHNGLLLPYEQLARKGVTRTEADTLQYEEWANQATFDGESFIRPDGTYMDEAAIRRVVALAGKTPEEADRIVKEIAAGTYDPMRVESNPDYYSPPRQWDQAETAPPSDAQQLAPPPNDALTQAPSPNTQEAQAPSTAAGTGSLISQVQENGDSSGDLTIQQQPEDALPGNGNPKADQAGVLGNAAGNQNVQPQIQPAVSDGPTLPDTRKNQQEAGTSQLPQVASAVPSPAQPTAPKPVVASQPVAPAAPNPAVPIKQPAVPPAAKPAAPAVPKPAISKPTISMPAVPKPAPKPSTPAPKPKPSVSKPTSSGKK